MDIQSLFSVRGKVALVTGGSRGIGEMIAAGYAANGATVYVSSRKAEQCNATAERLSSTYGAKVVSLPANLSGLEGVESLVAELAKREEHLDFLVNNAGVSWGAPLDEFPEAGWDKVMDTNVKGVFFLTQKLLPNLRNGASHEEPARVINVGSIDGLHVNPMDTYSYSASKAGVHHLTRAMARRLGPEHITVNAIAPGPFESKMMAATLKAAGDSIARMAPLGRIGRPDDMAGVAVYLASRAGAYVTGAVIPVDGGIETTS